MEQSSLVAVLIDCDNISYRHVDKILAEAATHGTVSLRRAYGDWHSPLLNGWRDLLPQYAIQPIHQPAYSVGKNSTDSALIIDAMDLLYADNIGVFCLVTSDGDYTRLAMRLRESARRVFGIGSRSAANAFQRACDRFTWLEVIETPSTAEGGPAAGGTPTTSEPAVDDPAPVESAGLAANLVPLSDLLLPALRAKAGDDGWAPLATVGHYAVGVDPSFDSRAYGFRKLGLLARAQPFLDVEERVDPHGSRQLWVRESRGDPSS